MIPRFSQRLASELLGTALLVMVVVGSGIMAERLAGGAVAIALLANALATGAGLVAIISMLSAVSAHFNPVVTLAAAALGALRWREVPWYLCAQLAGAGVGLLLAHAMFGEPLISLSRHERSGGPQILSEAVATFGLLAVIFGVGRRRAQSLPLSIGCYIAAAYWFTSSTSFANPVITLARAGTDTFTGIRPTDVPGFWLGQLAGAGLAVIVFAWLVPDVRVEVES